MVHIWMYDSSPSEIGRTKHPASIDTFEERDAMRSSRARREERPATKACRPRKADTLEILWESVEFARKIPLNHHFPMVFSTAYVISY